MNIEQEKEKIRCFIKSGLIGLSIVIFAYCCIYYVPEVVEKILW